MGDNEYEKVTVEVEEVINLYTEYGGCGSHTLDVKLTMHRGDALKLFTSLASLLAAGDQPRK